MARRGNNRRDAVDGILLLSKPAGFSSNQALQRVKYRLNARKAGHTGSLDPAATGMLPLCFGEATKVSAFLLDADKTYRVVARLGARTDSGDATGRRIEEAPLPSLTAGQWRDVLQRFLGESEQVPPMYSALKKDGQRLYELARRGEEVERAPRAIRIDAIRLLEAHGRRLVFRVQCSKGTYVRTLVEDIAKRAGTLAYTHSLHRESVAGFVAEDMLDFAEVMAMEPAELRGRLLPADRGLMHLAACELAGTEAERFRSGQKIGRIASDTGLRRVYGPGTEFLGVGEVLENGSLAPKRVFAASGQAPAKTAES